MTAREVRFGRYRLLERIGAGGMAEVHRAVVDGPVPRTCVIKRMLRDLTDDEAFVRMLLAEGRLTALLHHPNIVQLHEVGEVDGVYYLAMEYVEGVDLSSLLAAARQRLPLPPGVACAIACEIAAALAYAHALRDDHGPCAIVHRDVSPPNVMVTPRGAVKLLDFGIAKAADSLRDVETRTGTLKGKVAYMSPEQADGDEVDRRSDIFALGALLHELLTLRRLFRADDDLSTLKLVRACAVAPPGVDGELDAVVMKMLARRRDERFGSCDQLLAALLPVTRRLGGDAAAVRAYLEALGPIERRLRKSPPARETATFDLSPRPRPERRRRRRWLPPVLAAPAAALVLAAAMIAWRAPSVQEVAPPPRLAGAAPGARPIESHPAGSARTTSAAPPLLPAQAPPHRAHLERSRRHPNPPAAPRRDRDLFDPFRRP